MAATVTLFVSLALAAYQPSNCLQHNAIIHGPDRVEPQKIDSNGSAMAAAVDDDDDDDDEGNGYYDVVDWAYKYGGA